MLPFIFIVNVVIILRLIDALYSWPSFERHLIQLVWAFGQVSPAKKNASAQLFPPAHSPTQVVVCGADCGAINQPIIINVFEPSP